MKPRTFIIAGTLTLAVLAVLYLARYSDAPATYHQWRMNTAHNTLFGAPKTDGSVAPGMTGVDTDGVYERYMYHRDKLVNFGILVHFQAVVPKLVSDGSEESSMARAEFLGTLKKRFPHFRNYEYGDDGTFDVWVPAESQYEWRDFIDSEQKPTE